MGAAWRVGVDPSESTELVVRGPFRWVRNPTFTSMIVVAIGLALMVPSWVALVAVVALVASIVYQVTHVEEPYLGATHGIAYTEYLEQTGRFLPRLRP
jgi:protein-S-isoprenylcysteine O-methyltransferase Ste14